MSSNKVVLKHEYEGNIIKVHNTIYIRLPKDSVNYDSIKANKRYKFIIELSSS